MSVREGRRLARSIAVGPHTLTADEPQPISTDTGPTPGELLLAALAACTSMTVRAFADRHAWQLDDVDVVARFDSAGQIVKHVKLAGALDTAQADRLIAVAGRCPVQRLLNNEVSVVTVPTVVPAPRRAGEQPLPQ
ncbi:OsmC family protein [Streptomyces sp. BBFR51]|uniref:OsmC family protein n=1 Tax=Streptomyces sp. BBFR51 TaxID=3372856 RepID=UPI0037DCF44D